MREFNPVGKIVLPPNASDVKAINMALEAMYGRDVNQNRPRYRISWSTQKEVRFGTYSVFYMETIFLRDETGYVACSKYPFFADRWVLEALVFHPVPEIPDTRNGHYEPVYVFQDSKQNYLPPLHSIAEVALWSIRNPDKALTDYLARKDKESYDKEIEYFKDVLEDEHGSPLVTALHAHEAVTVPQNYDPREFNNTGSTKGIFE